MAGTIRLLDCTLRDGGQGLDDLNKNGIVTNSFSESDRKKVTQHISNAGIDIVELGCMEEGSTDKRPFSIYHDVAELSQNKPLEKNNQLYVGLYIGPDTPIDKIPDYSPELCDGIRVILRYSELKKSLNYCTALAKKGYKVFVQPMLTMRYSDDELLRIVDASNEMNAYALYFVDSYGYMEKKDVERLFRFYNERLNSSVNIGFHAHNNMYMAFENVKYFLSIHKERNVIIDSCVMGMGQGAGNLQTELIVYYLNKNYHKNYQLNEILEACEIIGKFKEKEMESWGYSPIRFIPAMYQVAYKYAVSLNLKHNKSLVDINNILANIPNEMRHRYTEDNVMQLLKKDVKTKN